MAAGISAATLSSQPDCRLTCNNHGWPGPVLPPPLQTARVEEIIPDRLTNDSEDHFAMRNRNMLQFHLLMKSACWILS